MCTFVQIFPMLETVHVIEGESRVRGELVHSLCKAKSSLHVVNVKSGSLIVGLWSIMVLSCSLTITLQPSNPSNSCIIFIIMLQICVFSELLPTLKIHASLLASMHYLHLSVWSCIPFLLVCVPHCLPLCPFYVHFHMNCTLSSDFIHNRS